MPTDLGRVRGSFIFTGNSTTSAQIKAELTAANKIYLDGDIYVVNSSSSHPYFVYNASNTTWEQKGTISGIPAEEPVVEHHLSTSEASLDLEVPGFYYIYMWDVTNSIYINFGMVMVDTRSMDGQYTDGLSTFQGASPHVYQLSTPQFGYGGNHATINVGRLDGASFEKYVYTKRLSI